VSGAHDIDPQMEKMLKAMGHEAPARQHVLEINPDHDVLRSMNALFEKDRESPLLGDYIQLLYDQAVLLEGGRPKDPVAFTKTLTRLMAERAAAG
jgi:molecular chaperone HtpG